MNVKETVARALPWALALIIFLIPLQTQWVIEEGRIGSEAWQYGTVSLFGIDTLIIGFGIIALSIRKKTTGQVLHHSWVLVGAIGVVSLFSVFFARDQVVAWYHFGLLGVGLMCLWLYSSPHVNRSRIIMAFTAAGLIQSALAMFQIITQRVSSSVILGVAQQLPATAGVSVIESTWGRFLRAYGTFQHPNILAGFLAVCVFFAVAGAVMSRTRAHRIGFVASIVIISVGIFLTMSRSVLAVVAVVFVVGIASVFTTQELRRFRRPLIFSAGVVALTWIVATWIFFPLVATRVAGDSRLEALSTEQRLTSLRDAREILRGDWLNGAGIGNFTAAVRDTVDRGRVAWQLQPAHNVYILIAAELGIFGAFFFLAFVVDLVARATKAVFRSGDPFAFFATAAFFSLMLMGLFDHYLWSLHPGVVLFWIVAGLIFRGLASNSQHVDNPEA